MSRRKASLLISLATSMPLAAFAAASASSNEDRHGLDVMEVVAPLSLEDADSTANVQAASAEAIAASGAADLADFLRRNMASVFVNEAQGNPLQGDVQYRGFVGSPLLGLPQGIAVHQDAVRVNEPFGDTVNWALIPDSAISSVFLVPGSSPLFGLNALGGALSVLTKDGFAHPGAKAELSAGSFGRWSLSAETGRARSERFGHFATASLLREEGWRDHSPTESAQAFGKLSWQRPQARVDLGLTLASTDLVGNGAAPEQLLAIDRTAIFTRPDRTRNRLALASLRGEWDFSNVSLQGNVYLRNSDIETYNGDDSDYEACGEDKEDDTSEGNGEDEAGGESGATGPLEHLGALCVDGELATDAQGMPIAADERLQGATINRTETAQAGRGFSVQAERLDTFGERGNRLALGIAVDRADIDFASSTELGRLDATRLAIPGGVFVGDAFTDVAAETRTAAFYVVNTLAATPSLTLTVSARYNRSRVILRDRLGTALDGDHVFRRLNPAASANYQATKNLAFYASYGESSRAPTPVELTCADEDAPCRLPNAFLADPPLEQVVASTMEAGARGDAALFRWQLAWFRSRNADDILFISAGAFTNEGYFDNIGTTMRRGIELELDGEVGSVAWFLRFAHLRATFEDAFFVPSANHPQATTGEIAVQAGDRLPLLPSRLIKGGIEWQANERLTLRGEARHSAGFRLRGDETNAVAGINGHTVVNLRASYRFDARLSGFLAIENALNERYATFGVFGEADEVLGDAFDDSRFLTPAAPRAGWVGIEVRR